MTDTNEETMGSSSEASPWRLLVKLRQAESHAEDDRRAADADFGRLYAMILREEPLGLSMPEVAAILQRAGKTSQDLAEAQRRVDARRAYLAELAAIDAQLAQERTIDEELASHDAELKAAAAKFQKAVDAFREKRTAFADLRRKRRDLVEARRRMVATPLDDERIAQLRNLSVDAERRLARVNQVAHNIRGEIAREQRRGEGRPERAEISAKNIMRLRMELDRQIAIGRDIELELGEYSSESAAIQNVDRV